MASRFRFFNDRQCESTSGFLPRMSGAVGPRSVMIVVLWKASSIGIGLGFHGRDLPRSEFGPWQTAWKRHRRHTADGTRDRVLLALLAMADTRPIGLDTVSRCTINRAHQHVTNTTHPDQDTGGWVGFQEFAAMGR